jgi:hypothetical protein
MTIPPEDLKFEEALKIFETQVAEATQFWFAAGAIDEVANLNPETLKAINLTPSFWITVRLGLQYQGILSVAKVLGPRSANPHNLDSLFQVLRECHLAVFSADALMARQRRMSSNANEWLAEFMKTVHVPTIDDVNALHALSKPHRHTYKTQWEQIRNEHVAHTGMVDPNAKWEMFQKTRIPDFEKLIVFLNEFHAALSEMYHNGRRPILELTAHSVKSLVAKNLNELGRVRNEEHIVAETRKCMFLITQAAKALPSGHGSFGSWE